MKKIFGISILLFFSITTVSQENPFNRGVNLTGWFQVNSPTEIHFTKYTKKDFENIKSLGADVIRLPINLHSMTLGAPNYELDPLFLTFLDQAVDWAEELEINLLLDNHTFDPATSTETNIGEILVPVWQNMAEHFKDRSDLVYYEILNEPHGIDDTTWNAIQQTVIDAIREMDTFHTIIVGPAGWNSYNNLKYMPEYEDDNLLYTFHFYDPFLFTHQGAGWTDPSLVPLSGIPFPYDAADMPPVPAELQNTWVAGSIGNYQNDGTISKVRELIDIATNFKEQRNVPIFCGEFGVYIPNSENNDRVLWYQIARTYMEYKNIAWTTWDYHGGFGIFEESGYGLFDYDLNTNLLVALGFNVPPQSDFELKPDSIGFGLYGDFIETGISGSGGTNGILNYHNSNSYSGEYCISWSNLSQYSSIGFQFIPLKDLSYLKTNNYHIGFWVKGTNPLSKLEMRFLDTKKDAEDHPWRMSYTIDNNLIDFNGEWQYIKIPLSSFAETGSWDNTWYTPIGLFDWTAVDKFEIVDEFGQNSTSQFWFDEIKIYDPNSTSAPDEKIVNEFQLFQNYPNPFNPTTTIEYSIPSQSLVSLKIYDLLGQEVYELLNDVKQAGKYSMNFDASNLASGIYYYTIRANNYFDSKKMILLK